MSTVLDRFRLDGRVALVTGGARGLGRAIATALVEAGAAVMATSRDPAAATAAGGALAAAGGAARGVALDVCDPASVEAAVAATTDAFGRCDILVNNAGITARGPLGDLAVAQWDAVVATNLRGAWLCSRAVVPTMRAAGGGRILNIASMFHTVGLPDRSPYVASKGGLAALTRALAVELAPDGITVNALCPGPFQTDLADDAARRALLAQIPLGRWGAPAEIGPAALFLVSDAAAFITGATLAIDGGYTAR